MSQSIAPMIPSRSSTQPTGSVRGQIPVTIVAHRKQVALQVWLPLGVALLAILALMVGVALTAASPVPSSVTSLSQWSDATMIVLIAPVAIACFFLLVILSGIVYLVARFLKILPPYTQLAQAYVFYASSLVRYWCDRIAAPVIILRGYWAGIEAAYKALRK